MKVDSNNYKCRRNNPWLAIFSVVLLAIPLSLFSAHAAAPYPINCGSCHNTGLTYPQPELRCIRWQPSEPYACQPVRPPAVLRNLPHLVRLHQCTPRRKDIFSGEHKQLTESQFPI